MVKLIIFTISIALLSAILSLINLGKKWKRVTTFIFWILALLSNIVVQFNILLSFHVLFLTWYFSETNGDQIELIVFGVIYSLSLLIGSIISIRLILKNGLPLSIRM